MVLSRVEYCHRLRSMFSNCMLTTCTLWPLTTPFQARHREPVAQLHCYSHAWSYSSSKPFDLDEPTHSHPLQPLSVVPNLHTRPPCGSISEWGLSPRRREGLTYQSCFHPILYESTVIPRLRLASAAASFQDSPPTPVSLDFRWLAIS